MEAVKEQRQAEVAAQQEEMEGERERHPVACMSDPVVLAKELQMHPVVW